MTRRAAGEPQARVRYEQAVYGSFPFWDKGYALLAHSPGCRPEWLDEFRAACQRFGERPRGVTEAFPGAMMSLRLASGPRLVVGVASPGADDHGRPDALAFHGLFVSERDFRRAGSNPFALAACLKGDWGPETTRLAPGSCEVHPPDPPPAEGSDAARVASALARGRRVAIESASPIDDLARAAWAALPERARRSRSVATWAFGNGSRFDLFATPRLAAVATDASYVDPWAPEPPRRGLSRPRTTTLLVGAAGVMALGGVAVVGMWLRRDGEPGAPSEAPPPVATIASPPIRPDPRPSASPRGPDRASYRDAPDDPAESLAVERGLAAFGRKFLGLEPDAARGPTAWMRAAAALRYEGPLLSRGDREAIARGTAPGRARALAWDDRIRRFAADRPLPPGFASGPLRWQLDTLAWSFHLDLDPTLTAAEMPGAIADALARDEPIEPNPLEAEYPALAEYARFLRRLPSR